MGTAQQSAHARRANQGNEALELLEGMQGRGLAADIITCSAAISTCEKGKRPGKELPEDMQWRGLLPVTPAGCEWGVSAGFLNGEFQLDFLL